MKQLLMAVTMITISLAAKAQDTTKKNNNTQKQQRAHLDYLLKIDGVNGESPDTLPPAPSLFSIFAGGTMSQTTNSNLAERYSAQYTQGFTVGIAYAREFRKSRLQIVQVIRKEVLQLLLEISMEMPARTVHPGGVKAM